LISINQHCAVFGREDTSMKSCFKKKSETIFITIIYLFLEQI
jgi:hypothetical protein